MTIPRSAYAELQQFLAAPSIPTTLKFWFILTPLLAPLIGHVGLFQTVKDDLPNVLEWSLDTDTRANALLRDSEDLAAEFEKLRDTLEKLSRPQSARDVDVFLGLSFDPSDDFLSIDVTTEPVLEGEDLATLAAGSTRGTSPREKDFDVPHDDVYFTALKTAKLLGARHKTIDTICLQESVRVGDCVRYTCVTGHTGRIRCWFRARPHVRMSNSLDRMRLPKNRDRTADDGRVNAWRAP